MELYFHCSLASPQLHLFNPEVSIQWLKDVRTLYESTRPFQLNKEATKISYTHLSAMPAVPTGSCSAEFVICSHREVTWGWVLVSHETIAQPRHEVFQPPLIHCRFSFELFKNYFWVNQSHSFEWTTPFFKMPPNVYYAYGARIQLLRLI